MIFLFVMNMIIQLGACNLAAMTPVLYSACMGSVEFNTKSVFALGLFIVLSQFRTWLLQKKRKKINLYQ